MEIKKNKTRRRQHEGLSSTVKTGIVNMQTNQEVEITRSIPAVCRQIKYYRELRNMEQKELARRLDIHPNAISNWENGRSRPDISILPAICKSLNISLYMLLDVENPIDHYTAGEQTMIDEFRALSTAHQFVVREMITSLKDAEMLEQRREVRKLIYFERPLAAGIGDPSEFLDRGDPFYLYANPLSNKADCIFNVNGDSMEPEFINGAMVYVQRFPNCGELQPGEIGAFIVGNEAYIKVFEKDGLHSLNKKYKTMHFTDEESVYLIGRVLGIVEYEDIAKDEDVTRYQRVFESVGN